MIIESRKRDHRIIELTFGGHLTDWRLGDTASVEDPFVGRLAGRIVGLSWLWYPERTTVTIEEDEGA